jgi:RNA polymerase sigma-70 factor (ECF subfamily)
VADVFTTHQPFIESVARRHAPSGDHVQDIVQAVGVQVCRGLNGFREEAQIRTWLYRVTVNAAIDYYRKERCGILRPREAIQATPEPEPVLDLDDTVRTGERLTALKDAIQRLRPGDRYLIVNALDEAAVLDSRKTSRHKALRRLKTLLEDDPRLTNE